MSHSRSQGLLVIPRRRRIALMVLLGCLVLGSPLLSSHPAEAAPATRSCGHALVSTVTERLELYFRTRHTACGVARRVVRQYFHRAPGECLGSGCFITLPSRWTCHAAPGEVSERDGPVAQCSREHGRQRILTSRFAERGFEPAWLVRRKSPARPPRMLYPTLDYGSRTGGALRQVLRRPHRRPTLNDGQDFRVKPATLDGWTFDGSQVFGGPSDNPPHGYFPGGSVGRITWTSWTTRHATGEGVVWTDDCEPSCGNGRWHPSPTLVTAYRPRRGTFQRMRFTCDCDEPAGTRARLRLKGELPPQWEIVRQW